jgi:UDP-glucose 4-epimerase
VFTVAATTPLRFLRVLDYPTEVLSLLRYGRVMDNERFKQAGFDYRYTTAGTVESFVQGQRLAGTVGDKNPAYRYERDVEEFFRHSPAVVRRDP